MREVGWNSQARCALRYIHECSLFVIERRAPGRIGTCLRSALKVEEEETPQGFLARSCSHAWF